MPERRIERVAVLYPGEMGSALGGALARAGLSVRAFVAERSLRTREAAARAGILPRESLEAAVADADLVVSLVPPEQALATARRFAAALLSGEGPRAPHTAGSSAQAPLYLEANSIAPAAVREVGRAVARAGALCVDGAILGSARDLPTRGRLLLSGEASARVARALHGALAVRVVGGALGDASAFKLCFSGFNKAVVAAFLESLCAAARAGFAEELQAALRDFYPGTLEALERQVPSYPRHAARRVAEMGDVAAWLAELGQARSLAEGARATFARVARAGLEAGRDWSLSEVVAELARRGALAGEPGAAGRG